MTESHPFRLRSRLRRGRWYQSSARSGQGRRGIDLRRSLWVWRGVLSRLYAGLRRGVGISTHERTSIGIMVWYFLNPGRRIGNGLWIANASALFFPPESGAPEEEMEESVSIQVG